MKIWLYMIAWNEEMIIHYTTKHYREFCDRLVLYDNCSSDRTVDVFFRSWWG